MIDNPEENGLISTTGLEMGKRSHSNFLVARLNKKKILEPSLTGRKEKLSNIRKRN